MQPVLPEPRPEEVTSVHVARRERQAAAFEPRADALPSASTLLLGGVFALLVVFTLYAARPILVPIVLGTLVALVLAPLHRVLRRLGLSESLAATVIVVGLLGALCGAALLLAAPAATWLQRAPVLLAQIKLQLHGLMLGIEEVREATKQVKEMAEAVQGGPKPLAVEEQSLGETLLTGTGQVVTNAVIVVVLTFFLLASGRDLQRGAARLFPRFGDRRRTLRISRAIEQEVSSYLLTVTVINLGLGAIVALIAWVAGLPSPVLWGALAALFNYIPFIGPLVTLAMLFLVGLVSLGDPLQALIAPALLLPIDVLEGNVITPSILARRLTLNPVVVFISLVVWGWMWGIAGVLLAVPILAAGKIACDHVPALTGVGRLLGDRSS
jgi:predicted PurR-regulated permease PerM